MKNIQIFQMKIRGKQEQNEGGSIKSGRSKSQHINKYIKYKWFNIPNKQQIVRVNFLKMTKGYVVYK